VGFIQKPLLNSRYGTCIFTYNRLASGLSAQTCVTLKLLENYRFVDVDLLCNGALPQISFLQYMKLVTLAFGEAVIGSHSCSFTFYGEKHLGITASSIIPWVKLHWPVEFAVGFKSICGK